MPDALSPHDVPRDVAGGVAGGVARGKLHAGPDGDVRDHPHGGSHALLDAELHGDLNGDLPAVELATTVVVALGTRAATPAEDHRVLACLVARLAGVDAASVTLTQLCPNCGLTDHGALRVQLTGAPATVYVSLARSGDRLVLAVTAAGPVGIDLESVADIARAPLHDVLLSPAEADALARLGPPETEAAVAALWTAKEAVLKAAGVGLRVDPRELTIIRGRSAGADGAAGAAGQTSAGVDAKDNDAKDKDAKYQDAKYEDAHYADTPRLVDWPRAPFPLAELHVLSLATPPGTVGTVAVVCARRPTLRILPPGPEPRLGR